MVVEMNMVDNIVVCFQVMFVTQRVRTGHAIDHQAVSHWLPTVVAWV